MLAGSWTDTGWPATLEGAVMSGHAAAAEALAALQLATRRRAPGEAQFADGAGAAAHETRARRRAAGAGGGADPLGACAARTCARPAWGPTSRSPPRGRSSREPGDALLVLGFCGGLDAQARPGEVIVADEVLAAADEGHEPVQRALRRRRASWPRRSRARA